MCGENGLRKNPVKYLEHDLQTQGTLGQLVS